ncbi:zinc finger protein ZFP2-like [Spodoptera frugiperda]|uniref:Zinc finger protein ZFP2-like n=1 Tax=Spodoptera frugiperda TaxID=7108 RepID=A0A9R0E1A1_SPOFR|nr:zinc finger protein ZFP2-like [Spodoptera frugiperda]
MSSFLCFICRNTVNTDTNEDSREKYKEIVGMNLCPDSHLCYICDHLVNKLWLFKSLCLKRSLEYPVLFSAKGTVNLQRSTIKPIILCTEEICSRTDANQFYIENKDQSINSHDYIKLEDDRDDYEESDYFHEKPVKEGVKCTDHLDMNDGEMYNNHEEMYGNDGETFGNDSITYNNDAETCNNDGKTFVNDGETYNNSRQTYNKDGQTYGNDSQTINNDNEMCDNVSITYNNDEETYSNNSQTYGNESEIYGNNSQKYGNNSEIYGNNSQTYGNNSQIYDNNSQKYGNNSQTYGNNSKMFNNDELTYGNDSATYNNDNELDNNTNTGVNQDDMANVYENNDLNADNVAMSDYYAEEKIECLNEIRNECGVQDVGESDDKKSDENASKTKTKAFEKILLSFEEQKAELEQQRRSKKYLEAEFKCYNCALGFLFKDTYQTHMMRHEESNGEYRCDVCSLRFATGAVLRSHAALHAARYRCLHCSLWVRARQTNTHAKYCHQSATVATCHLCGRLFQDSSGLHQHLKRFHMTRPGNRTYSCSVCGKNYNNQAAVRTHMIKHIHRKFSCDQCASIFSSPYTLSQHKKKHANTEESKQYYCETCGVSYSTRKSLLAHQRQSLNHQSRSYECPICNRACPNEKSLSSHISAVHSTTKDYCCSTCNARYTNRKSLVRHIRSHTNPTPVKLAYCHICGNSFKGKSKLNRHLREVCEKDKLEEELSSYYDHQHVI